MAAATIEAKNKCLAWFIDRAPYSGWVQQRQHTNLPLIGNDDAPLNQELRIQQVPVTAERGPVHEHDVRQLARFERAKLIAHFDIRSSVRSHQLDDVLHREHQVEGLQLVLEAGLGCIVRIRAVTVDHAGVPRRSGIDGFVSYLLAPAIAVENRFRPRSSVAKPGFVVVGEDTEDRHAKSNGRQLLDAGASYLLCIVEGQPAEMGSMNELADTRVNGGHHGLWTDGMDLDPHAGLLRFVHHGSEIFQFFGRRSRLWCERLLADELDSQCREPLHFRASHFGSVVRQIHTAGRNDARSLDDAFLDMVPEGQISFCGSTARQDRRVAGVEKLLHLLLLIGTGVDVPMGIDESRQGSGAARIDGLQSGNIRGAGRDGNDPSPSDDDRSLIDPRAVANNNPYVRDREVLPRKTRDSGEARCPRDQDEDKASIHDLPYLLNVRRSFLNFATTPALRSAASLIVYSTDVQRPIAISDGVRLWSCSSHCPRLDVAALRA